MTCFTEIPKNGFQLFKLLNKEHVSAKIQYCAFHRLPQICTASQQQIQYRFAVIFGPVGRYNLPKLALVRTVCLEEALSNFCIKNTLCPRSSDPFHVVTYYINWVTISWTNSSNRLSSRTYWILFEFQVCLFFLLLT